ncbi:MAG: hypothetical protein AABY07_00375 [Nanoarchaeota archaeon]
MDNFLDLATIDSDAAKEEIRKIARSFNIKIIPDEDLEFTGLLQEIDKCKEFIVGKLWNSASLSIRAVLSEDRYVELVQTIATNFWTSEIHFLVIKNNKVVNYTRSLPDGNLENVYRYGLDSDEKYQLELILNKMQNLFKNIGNIEFWKNR